ncbi:MAG TPA: hypothetical protein VGN12_04645 [Pirellulales bacterium]
MAVALAFVSLQSTSVWATPLTYSFQGTMLSKPLQPYGLTIPGTVIAGQFSYDPDTPATRTLNSGLGYDQHIVDGFHATIGGVTVSASDYVVEIVNNIVQPDHTVKDEFSIVFSSAITPALDSSLVVNGTARSAGLFNVTFIGDSSLYPATTPLPNFNFRSFTSGLGLFSDAPVGVVDVFTVTPEPTGVVLLAIGAALFGARYFRQRPNR